MSCGKATTMIMLILALTAMAVFPSSVSAKATKTYFTKQDYFVGIIDLGTSTYLPSGGIHIRGMINQYTQVSTDSRYTGSRTTIFNANLDKDGTGRIWGTFTVVVDGGGSWEGTYTGWISSDRTCYVRAEEHGRGVFEGFKLHVTVVYAPGQTPEWSYGEGSGYILNPHGA